MNISAYPSTLRSAGFIELSFSRIGRLLLSLSTNNLFKRPTLVALDSDLKVGVPMAVAIYSLEMDSNASLWVTYWAVQQLSILIYTNVIIRCTR